MSKKITKATIKSFIRKYNDSLHIKKLSTFDGMVDCAMSVDSEFLPIERTESCLNNTLGIEGAWFVGRDSYRVYSDGAYVGFEVYNCCGSFILAVPFLAIPAFNPSV